MAAITGNGCFRVIRDKNSQLRLKKRFSLRAATIASLLVSLDLGKRWTGYAMVIFVTSSLALIGWGFLQPDSEGIGMQNIVLLVINGIGVWRYLVVPGKARATRV